MDNEKLYEDMKPKEKFEVLWAESGLANRPGAEKPLAADGGFGVL